LRALVGRNEVKESLGTTDTQLGKSLALRKAALYLEAFNRMKKDNELCFYEIIMGLDGTLTVKNPTPEESDLVARIARERAGVVVAASPSKPLQEIWDLYSKQRMAEEGWSQKTYNEMHTPIERYFAYCADKSLDPYLKATAATYPAVLLKQITKRGTSLSPTTANQHIERLSALFKWAVTRGYAPVNPFDGLKVKIGARVKAKQKRRLPYTHAEIEKILAVLDVSKDERHWLILIGLYTGCRINEGAQLYADDISTENGMAYINVREGRFDQKIKGHKPRKVPISPHLLKAGFLTWVGTKMPSERLFSDFTCGRDGYGQSASKWYNRTFRKEHAIEKDFHSFRHTTQVALDGTGVSERVINAILGHAAGKSMSLTVYEHGLPLSVLQDAINKLPINPGRRA